jgi:hypothetical protein
MFMSRPIWLPLLALGSLLATPGPARPCSLCNPQGGVTIRQAATQARMILFGTVTAARLNPPDVGLAGSGTCDFRIDAVLKTDPFLANRKVIEVPRYIPVDPKKPLPRFVLFCDVFKGKLDAYRGMATNSAAVLKYIQGTMALDPRDSAAALLFFFRYLDHSEPDLANDAYLEFARANDGEIGRVGARLAPERIRALMQNPRTPAERLGLYAFLLGACGQARDAALLRAMLDRPTERTGKALDGLLGGYIQMKPREGWQLAVAVLGNPRRPFPDRFAALRTLRFYHAWKPQETRPEVLRGLAVMLDQGDIADMAIEDLRRWQMWDLTGRVFAQFGKKSHSAPILRRAIVRYALCCPRPEAAQFLARLRKLDPQLIADVRESLEFEKTK